MPRRNTYVSRKLALMAAAVAGVGMVSTPALAVDRFWVPPGGGAFAVPANWAPAGVPVAGDTANFTLLGPLSYVVTFAAVHNTAGLLVDGESTVTFRRSGGAPVYNAGLVEIRGIDSPTPSTLIIDTGMKLTATALAIGANPFAAATRSNVIVRNANSSLSVSGETFMGNPANLGTLTIEDSATATFGGTLNVGSVVGFIFGHQGEMAVRTGAKATANADVKVGDGFSGSLLVENVGSNFTMTGATNLLIGAAFSGQGRVAVLDKAIFQSGTGATLVNSTGTLVVATGGSFTAGGNMTVAEGGTVLVNDNDSSLKTDPGAVALIAGTMNISLGGDAVIPRIEMGASAFALDPANIVVENPGSTLTTATSLRVGTSGTFGSTVFRDRATGALGAVIVGSGDPLGTAGAGLLRVESGAQVTSATLHIGNIAPEGNVSEVQVSGGGNAATKLTNAGALVVGAASGGSATLRVDSNATLDNSAGTTTLNATGQIIISEATARLGALTHNGGSINFISGDLGFQGNFRVGSGGPFGGSLVLTPQHILATNGTATIDPFHVLTLAGGQLSVANLVKNGTFDFSSGELRITGGGGLTIGAGGALGATVEVEEDQTITVSNATTVAATGLLLVTGGTLNATGGLTNNGEIQLDGATARIAGGTLTNNKLITGDGRVDAQLANAATGEVRASGDDRLIFTAANATNSGRITLINGGTAEFAGTLTNNAAGKIMGTGTLITGGATLVNNGQVLLTGGFSNVFGPVTSNAGSLIVVTGGGTGTFYNAVTLNGSAEFRTSANSNSVFLAPVTCANTTNFTGSGTKYFEFGESNCAGVAAMVGGAVVEANAVLNTNFVREQFLTVNGLVNITPSGDPSRVSRVEKLFISSAGRLNLNDNDLIVQATPGTRDAVFNQVHGYVATGRNGGLWNGVGINSAAAAANPDTGLATILNDTGDGAPVVGLVFDGMAVDINSVLVKYSWNGDADLNGSIDADDYFQIDSGFLNSLTGYRNGDFDYNGSVDADDYFLIDSAFLNQTGPLAGAVPEPAAGLLVGVVAAGMALGRNRGRGRADS